MDARVDQRALPWADSVLRKERCAPRIVRAMIFAAIVVGGLHVAASEAMAWQAPVAAPSATAQYPANVATMPDTIRLPPPDVAPGPRRTTPFDGAGGASYYAGQLPAPAGGSAPLVVPWRTSEEVVAPPITVQPGALTARLRQGPIYDGKESVVSQAEPLPAPGGAPLPRISDGSVLGGPVVSSEPERPGYAARWFGPGIREGGEMLSNVPFDYKNFYSLRSLAWLGGGVGIAAILANTSADKNFQNWYDDKIKGKTSDHLTSDISWLGHGQLMVPIFIAAGLVLTPFEERFPLAHGVGQWGRRTTRGFLVGGPMLLALQYTLGPDRPRKDTDSHWHPFKGSHGASGDAFVAGIALMSAAKEVDNPIAKGALYAASILPAWGRVNDDAHYFSQAFLGVWLAAVTITAVDLTDRSTTTFIVPYVEPGVVGGRVGWRW